MPLLENVPGRCGYPVIGETSVEFYRDPVKYVNSRNCHHTSEIFLVRFLNNPTIFISSPWLIKELLNEKFHDFGFGYKAFLQKIYGDNILFHDGAHAETLRSLFEPLFQDSTKYQQCFDSVIDPFVSSLKGRHDVPIYEEIKHMMTKLCLQLFLGLDVSTSEEVVENIQDLATKHWHGIISVPISIRVPMGGPSTFAQALQAKEKLLVAIRKVIAQSHYQSGCRNVLQSMQSIEFPDDKTAEQHLLMFVSALIPKAFASILNSFVLAMSGSKKKVWRQRAIADENFLADALLEVERLWPPFFGGRRLALKQTTVGRYKIPKDYAVVYASHVAHRDEQVFPRPDEFLPERWTTWNADHRDLVFCFGGGPRCCIGRTFIGNILRDVAARLLRTYDWEMNPTDQEINYKYLPVARPENATTVKFQSICDVH
uniref:Beta-amyrin 11-oxidase n=1 Tax=Phallusia mammillata TaxID=59560 RepID=A0A6F9DB41_9ASCI|nr:beta-amyrin 11-oxidase [Phallusia mammillata]